MIPLGNSDVTHVRGTLVLQLSDGNFASLEVDLDLSSPRAGWSIQHDLLREEQGWPFSAGPSRPIGTTYSIYIPTDPPQDSHFVIRAPSAVIQ